MVQRTEDLVSLVQLKLGYSETDRLLRPILCAFLEIEKKRAKKLTVLPQKIDPKEADELAAKIRKARR